ncbi:MAG: bifunctional metallophosphatase/5'-nucleotidase [Gemmataceae bacterium]
MNAPCCRPGGRRAGWKKLLALAAATAVVLAQLVAHSDAPKPGFAVTIIHTNDWHANHAPQAAGDGGSARQATVIKRIQAEVTNSMLLDAGDRFTGTLLHQPGGPDNVPLMNGLGFKAMTLGNHEFDDGDDQLALFIRRLEFPVVSANLDVSKSRELRDLVKPYCVVKVAGERVGIIGLTTADSKINSHPGKDVGFRADYAACVQPAADELDRQGVNKIIVLSHIGLDEDRKLAAQVSKVDLIVGGHSHTVLGRTYQEAKDDYPVVVKDKEGRPVYIVQAGGGDGRFVGRLDVEFDSAGNVTKAAGDNIHLSHYIPPDPVVQQRVEAMQKRVAGLMGKPIVGPDGREARALDEFPAKLVRDAETAIGNLVTDAVRDRARADVALLGGGGIRNGIPAGVITRGTVKNAFPFDNTLCVVRIQGKVIVEALENGLSRYTVESGRGRFLQVSGLRFTFDPAKPVGSRVVNVGTVGDAGIKPLDPEAVYRVGCDSFLWRGGDEFTMLKAKADSSENLGYPIRDVVEQYIAERSPLQPKIEGRIVKR